MEQLKYPPFASPSEKKALQMIRQKLSSRRGIERVIFFGSRLRGDFTGESDNVLSEGMVLYEAQR